MYVIIDVQYILLNLDILVETEMKWEQLNEKNMIKYNGIHFQFGIACTYRSL